MGKTAVQELPEIELKVGLSFDDLVSGLKRLNHEEREFFLENLLAATSPGYLRSIREARKDRREGRVSSHKEVFGK